MTESHKNVYEINPDAELDSKGNSSFKFPLLYVHVWILTYLGANYNVQLVFYPVMYLTDCLSQFGLLTYNIE